MRRVKKSAFLLHAAVALALAGQPLALLAQDAPPVQPGAVLAPPQDGAATPVPTTQPATTAPSFVPGPIPTGPSNVEIRIPSTKPAVTKFSFNFKDAPIDAVLNHISAEAGFT